MSNPRYALFSVLNRYLVRQFLSILVPVLASFVLLYVVVDLFDRLDILLRHKASAGAAVRYFVFKIPLMVTQVIPPAVITSVLLSLGLLARHNEITALRAGGIGLVQTTLPILLSALAISLAVLLWNETVVPHFSRLFQHVNNVEIRKRNLRAILSDREIWYHGRNGFYNIEHVDKAHATIYGLSIFRLNADFQLQSVIDVEKAEWIANRWQISNAVERNLGGGAFSVRPLSADEVAIPETWNDFVEVRREPEEMSFRELRDWVNGLTRKGIDASQYLVELHLKLAVPFSSVVLALVGLPISGRVRRHPSVAAILGIGIAVGFAYWVVLGLGNSLGQTGALPPIVAAWSANAIFALVGLALFLAAE